MFAMFKIESVNYWQLISTYPEVFTCFLLLLQLSSLLMISAILGMASSAACTSRNANLVLRASTSTNVQAYSFTAYFTSAST